MQPSAYHCHPKRPNLLTTAKVGVVDPRSLSVPPGVGAVPLDPVETGFQDPVGEGLHERAADVIRDGP